MRGNRRRWLAAAAGIVSLVAAGIVVDRRDNLGKTPLQLAVLARQAETAKLLLARGADPNLRDNYGLSPIDSIRPHGYTEIEELLRQAGGKAGEELPPSPQSDRPRRE
jgi:ankyrin repeat protein